MRRIIFMASVVVACLSCLGAVRPNGLRPIEDRPYGGGLRPIDPSGGAAPKLSYNLLVRDYEFPNTMAITNGWVDADDGSYDRINEGSGTDYAIRVLGTYALTNPDLPFTNNHGSTAGRVNKEVDYNPANEPRYFTMFAVDLGGLSKGMRVNEAKFNFNVMNFNSFDLTTGYANVCLDTVLADYDCLDALPTYGVNLNRWIWSSWDYKNVNTLEPWDPPWSGVGARDDMNDTGPRGLPLQDGVSHAANTGMQLDFTLQLQEALDSGLLEKTDGWALLWVYHLGTPAMTQAIMIGDSTAKTPQGNPAVTVNVSPFRGPVPFGEYGIPVSLTLDDNYPEHIGYFRATKAAGQRFTTMYVGSLLYAGPPAYANYDSLYELESDNIDLVAHSWDHSLLGTVTDQLTLNNQVSRSWVPGGLPSSDVDTAGIIHFAWPGGAPPEDRRSIQAIETMIDFSYISSRASATSSWDPDGIGKTVMLSWDAPVNMFLVGAPAAGAVFGEGVTRADLEENIRDWCDIAWTGNARAPLVLYGHRSTGDGLTEENIGWFYEIIDELSFLRAASYVDLVTIRDGPRIPPSDIAVMNGAVLEPLMHFPHQDSTAIHYSAAQHDSIIGLGGHDQLNEMWVGPKKDYAGIFSGAGGDGGNNPWGPFCEIRFFFPEGGLLRVDYLSLSSGSWKTINPFGGSSVWSPWNDPAVWYSSPAVSIGPCDIVWSDVNPFAPLWIYFDNGTRIFGPWPTRLPAGFYTGEF